MKKKIQIFWQQWKGLLLNTSSMGGIVIFLIYLGLFQLSELGIYDFFIRNSPKENPDDRIVVVTIDDQDITDLKQWPINDKTLAKVLQTINDQKPIVMGLDIYRDLPVPPGVENLTKFFQNTPNIIGVEKFITEQKPILSHQVLEDKDQVALSEFMLDSDGKARRALLSIETKDDKIKFGLGAKLALMYLEKKEIKLKTINEEKGIYQLGKAVITNLNSQSGGYVNADSGGYQILINYRGENNFTQVKFKDILNKNFNPKIFKNSIVLVGTTANSIKDWFTTPYNIQGEQTPGVIIHAHITSQLISAAINNRQMLNVLPEQIEWLWVLFWAGNGATVSWIILERTLYGTNVIVSVGAIFVGIIIMSAMLILTGYFLFINGWWIPTAAPLTALVITALSSAGSKAHQVYRLAILDGLTQISNRRYFDEQINRWWWRLTVANKPLSILLGDVDFFKPYNDNYGHQLGDRCLQSVAKALHQSIRGTDIVARYGGEEFVVILPNTNTENALKVAERIRVSIKELKIPHKGSKVDEFVSMSFGLATVIPDAESSPSGLIAKADEALYQAKQQGRDRVVIHELAQI